MLDENLVTRSAGAAGGAYDYLAGYVLGLCFRFVLSVCAFSLV